MGVASKNFEKRNPPIPKILATPLGKEGGERERERVGEGVGEREREGGGRVRGGERQTETER